MVAFPQVGIRGTHGFEHRVQVACVRVVEGVPRDWSRGTVRDPSAAVKVPARWHRLPVGTSRGMEACHMERKRGMSSFALRAYSVRPSSP